MFPYFLQKQYEFLHVLLDEMDRVGNTSLMVDTFHNEMEEKNRKCLAVGKEFPDNEHDVSLASTDIFFKILIYMYNYVIIIHVYVKYFETL